MILKLRCEAIINGTQFYPEFLIIPNKIRVAEKRLLGEVIRFGRYQGNLSTEGILIIDGNIEDITQFILCEILSKFSRETIELNLCISVKFEGECNFVLSVDQIKKFLLLETPLNISCYSG
jgi:hypothetical protein